MLYDSVMRFQFTRFCAMVTAWKIFRNIPFGRKEMEPRQLEQFPSRVGL